MLLGFHQQVRRPQVVVGPKSDHTLERTILAIEDGRNPTPQEWSMLTALARRGGPPEGAAFVQRMAVRALGRLGRRDAIPLLVGLLPSPSLGTEAARSLTLILRADLPDDPADAVLLGALEAVRQQPHSPEVLGNLPYTSPVQVDDAENTLRAWLEFHNPPNASDARGVEALARRNRNQWQIKEDTRTILRRLALREDPRLPFRDDATPRNALAALMAAGAVDEEVLSRVISDRADQVRRLAARALYSGGARIEPEKRTALILEAFGDASAQVRYDAVRAWARRETPANGCALLVDALRDESPHVVLAAMDALGEGCREDDAVTDLVAGEARMPPSIGEWQRQAHALVALAKRAPERAAMLVPSFRQHLVWQVRMYAARTAAVLKDADTLERLAYDDEDNVREAALPALRAIRHGDSDSAFVAALRRRDYQLLRTAALELKDAQPRREIVSALTEALQRVTAEQKDTSRDTRLALLERLRALGSRDQYSVFERLLRDFDPKVAAAAAAACSELAGKPIRAEPQLRARPPAPSAIELEEPIAARVQLESGQSFDIAFDKTAAPLAYSRFVRLVRERYYNGLTFHRVVGNFIVQGGSPGANEYEGETRFWRDEIGLPNLRGTVGISTRGRDTGDGQFFINLVDNPSLDFEYTVFGAIPEKEMPVVDGIVEGTKIQRVFLVPAR